MSFKENKTDISFFQRLAILHQQCLCAGWQFLSTEGCLRVKQIAADFIDTMTPFTARMHNCRNVSRPCMFSVCHVICDARDDHTDSRAQRWVWMLGLQGSIRPHGPPPPPFHHPAAHARQAVRPHITTLGPGAVFSILADVVFFYETLL